MPTIVIHSMGHPAQKTNLALRSIRVGRDPEVNDVVLPGLTVSREHAVLSLNADGRWYVQCLAAKNPIVVDGALTDTGALLSEGSEILVGTEYLLLFALTEAAAQQFMGLTSHFAKAECRDCHWIGMVSTLRRDLACPRCGGRGVVPETVYRRDVASAQAEEGVTKAVDQKDVRVELARLRAAKRSHIERLDEGDPGVRRRDLNESEPLRFGKTTDCPMKLGGFLWGDGFEVAWDGQQFVARSRMTFPALKVNGVSTRVASLSNGDVLSVGSNRFKLVME